MARARNLCCQSRDGKGGEVSGNTRLTSSASQATLVAKNILVDNEMKWYVRDHAAMHQKPAQRLHVNAGAVGSGYKAMTSAQLRAPSPFATTQRPSRGS